jgi:hypothetical protein
MVSYIVFICVKVHMPLYASHPCDIVCRDLGTLKPVKAIWCAAWSAAVGCSESRLASRMSMIRYINKISIYNV